MSKKKCCAYCGLITDKLGKDHVFPKNLYPKSIAKSNIQRLTIPACTNCNNSWADYEAHFRNVLAIAGDPSTPVRMELWNTTVDRSFSQVDGLRRLKDLQEQLKPVIVSGKDREIVYPGNDARVVRIIQKIVRGLSFHHKIFWPLPDERIFVDILKYEVPDYILNEMEYDHRDKDIVEYRFKVFNEIDIQSAWIITFFQTVSFIAIVSSG